MKLLRHRDLLGGVLLLAVELLTAALLARLRDPLLGSEPCCGSSSCC